MRFAQKGLVAGIATLGMAAAAFAVTPTPTYLMKAGASDLFEIKASQLVEGSTKNAAVKSFAQQMVTDHNKSTAMVKAAATKSGLSPKPPMLDAKQKSDYAALQKATGAARDQLYIEQQKASHQEALDLQQDYAASGDKPALKAAAGQIVPVVQHHIEMLGSMGS